MIGVFGISEVMRNVSQRQMDFAITKVKTKGIFAGVGKLIKKYQWNMWRSGAIGTFIGVLPGAGADIAAWIAYAASKRASKEKELYGKGSIEAIVDAGTANNACLAGDWVPALVFGIPGDSITAVVIGVIFMKGLRPGPMIFEQQPEIIYGVYFAFIVANLLMVPFGWLAVKVSSQMLRVPKNILVPIILMFAITGAFAINNDVFDIITLGVMGIVGYFMEKKRVPGGSNRAWPGPGAYPGAEFHDEHDQDRLESASLFHPADQCDFRNLYRGHVGLPVLNGLFGKDEDKKNGQKNNGLV